MCSISFSRARGGLARLAASARRKLTGSTPAPYAAACQGSSAGQQGAPGDGQLPGRASVPGLRDAPAGAAAPEARRRAGLSRG